MIVGVARLDLSIPGAQSLKDKRAVLRRIKDKVRQKFSCALAEVGDQDEWEHGQLGVAVVSGDHRMAESVLQQIVDYIHEISEARITSEDKELLTFGEELGQEPSHWEPEAPNPPIGGLRTPSGKVIGPRSGAGPRRLGPRAGRRPR